MKWLRIPHSVFAAYDRDDRDKALWWWLHEIDTCTCGTRPDEWDLAKGGRPDAYRAELRKCWGCAARSAGEKQITADLGPGVSVVLTRTRGV